MASTSVLSALPTAPASLLKQKGWKSIVRELASTGRLVVTNHKEPEAVILSVGQYKELVESAQSGGAVMDSALATLRQKFDQRLEALNAEGAANQLRALMQSPGKLEGVPVDPPDSPAP